MKVLHVIPSISLVHGGPSRAMATIERALSLKGVQVTTLTTDDDGDARRLATPDRLKTVNGASRIYVRKWSDIYKFAPGAATWLTRHVRQFDIVHIHALFSFLSGTAAMFARSYRIPYVIRPLGTLASYGLSQRRPVLKRLSLSALEGPLLKHAAAVQFTSESERADVEALGIAVRGVVIPLGLDAPVAGEPHLLANEYASLRERKVILFLSRLDPKKNVEGLLSAFAMLGARRKDIALLIAGDGPDPYVATLKALAKSKGIGDDVVWLGHVDGARKAAAFALADVFVLPSHSENFGIAAAEAMLAGLPCILGEGVAVASDLEAEGAGVPVKPEPASIAHAMEGLLADDGGRAAMGTRAECFARREYSSDAMGERLVHLYDGLIRAHSRKTNHP